MTTRSSVQYRSRAVTKIKVGLCSQVDPTLKRLSGKTFWGKVKATGVIKYPHPQCRSVYNNKDFCRNVGLSFFLSLLLALILELIRSYCLPSTLRWRYRVIFLSLLLVAHAMLHLLSCNTTTFWFTDYYVNYVPFKLPPLHQVNYSDVFCQAIHLRSLPSYFPVFLSLQHSPVSKHISDIRFSLHVQRMGIFYFCCH